MRYICGMEKFLGMAVVMALWIPLWAVLLASALWLVRKLAPSWEQTLFKTPLSRVLWQGIKALVRRILPTHRAARR